MPGTLVVAESRQGGLRQITFELISAALELAEPVRVLLVSSDPSRHAAELGVPGVEEVLTVTSPVDGFEAHLEAEAVKAVIEAEQPRLVLTANSADALGFAPAVAAELGLGFAAGASRIDWEDGEPVVSAHAYGDRLMAKLTFPDKPTVLVMVRAGAYERAPTGGGTSAVRDAGVSLDPATAATEHLGYATADQDGIDFTASPFVLAIGRGVQDAEGVEELEAIARQLGATLSVSGGLVDAGLVSKARKVGLTGKSIKPRVYLALGISGASQHVSGIRQAGTVIAVNIDPDAPIFSLARYGAVADLFEIARALPGHFR